MHLQFDVEEILQESHYTCFAPHDAGAQILFEDENLLGVVAIFDSPSALLSNWASVQQWFLESAATHLRRAAEKSWNCYTILLCATPIAKERESELTAIEEDFTATRKIARCGVSTKEDVRRSLLPVLPIQHSVTVRPNVMPDLRMRLSELPSRALEALASDVPAAVIASMLLEDK